MEDKRTAIALFLCLAVIMVYTEVFIAPYTRPSVTPNAPATSTLAPAQALNVPPVGLLPSTPIGGSQTTSGIASAAGGTTLPSAGATPPRALAPSPAEIKSQPIITIESDEFIASITQLGARLMSFKLKSYKLSLHADEPLDLVATVDGAPLPLGFYGAGTHDGFVAYAIENASVASQNGRLRVPSDQELTLTFVGQFPTGATIRKTFTFRPSSYLFSVGVSLSAPVADGSKTWLEWARFVPTELTHDRYSLEQFTLLDTESKIQHVMLSSLKEDLHPSGSVNWIASGDKYFIAALLPAPHVSADGISQGSSGPNSVLGKAGEIYVGRAGAGPSGGNFELYIGPKSFKALRQAGHALDRSIDLGIFTFLAYPLLLLMKAFNQLFNNYGLAIILLTLTVKTLFLPLTKASVNSMKAMQDLQPEMKALRERVKDPTQLNQEMMALYKKRGVNPMGGCLPMLIQVPVFLGLYNALLNAIELRHSPFALWINDLSSTERLDVFGVGVPVMVFLMGATFYVQQKLSPAALDPQQQKIMTFMPIIFTGMFLIFPVPSGLTLYMLVNSTISIIQQQVLKHDSRFSPLQATLLASFGIFSLGYILHLL